MTPTTAEDVSVRLTVADLDAFSIKINRGDVTADQVREMFEHFLLSADAVVGELSRKTLKELKPYLGWHRPRNKAEAVEMAFDNLQAMFMCGMTLAYSWDEKRGDVIRRDLAKLTDDHIQKRAAEIREKTAEFKKSLTNPETLEEFETFVQCRGVGKLNAEQKARYETMKAEEGKLARQKHEETVIAEISGKVRFRPVKKSYHARRGCDIWIVQLEERIDRRLYEELLEKAKKLGGWYSSFIKADAGFTFLSEESANTFYGLQDGAQDISELAANLEQQSAAVRADKLDAKAEGLREDAEDRLAAERKTNTARRVSMAEGVERRARADLQLADTLSFLADAHRQGQLLFLNKLKHITELRLLILLLSRARYEHAKVTQDRSVWEREPNDADAGYAKFPYPVVDKQKLLRCVEALKNRNGCMRISDRIRRILYREEHSEECSISFPPSLLAPLLEFADKLRCLPRNLTWEREHIQDSLYQYKTLTRVDIPDEYTLRSALRELCEYMAQPTEADPLVTACRALIGTAIPGWYPSPFPVIDEMLSFVTLKDGMKILEPEAGRGDIADEILRRADVTVHCVEPVPALRSILELKGHELIGADLFDLPPDPTYDLAIMNPPFENGDDDRHIRHVYDHFLKPGGSLVSVMGAGIRHGANRRQEDFRHWLEDRGGRFEPLPEGAFLQSDRPTGVNTVLAIMSKPTFAISPL